ncbi:MAG: 50S ribosomal protein L18 [Euryarchaeota archaeon]|nr:50S ribosomal protein L18 [Euryarchaeota archaeon]
MGRARGPRGPTHRVPFRRRREGKTDYHRRVKLLFSKKHRVVVRKSNRYIRMQLISADRFGDKTLVTALSSELTEYGYDGGKCNCSAAYLTGLLFGKRAKEAGFDDGILDIGLNSQVHGSNVYAALKGAVDSGLTIPHDPVVFPVDDRIIGNHIASFLQKPDIVDMFHATKDKITSEKR